MLNATDNSGNTPLQLATDAGRAEAVKVLLAEEANTKATDNSGKAEGNKAPTSCKCWPW